MANVKKARTTVRFASTKDIPSLLELDVAHGEGIWTPQELHKAVNEDQSMVVLTAVYDKKIVGMMVYEIKRNRFSVIYMVAANNHLDLIGKALFTEMMTDFNIMGDMESVIWYVRESDTDFQVYLRDEFQFRCTHVKRGWYRDHNPGEGVRLEDGYRFVKTKEQQG